MGKLQEYEGFENKQSFFDHHVIDSKRLFDKFYLNISENSIWRGVSEAKYKIYTSLQRLWIERDLPDNMDLVFDYLNHILGYSKKWNLEFLKKYFENYEIEGPTIYSTLSILRHHGTPTPLLDWTRNPKIGLFFATEYCNTTSSKRKIDNYFSLYELKEKHPYVQFVRKYADLEFLPQQDSFKYQLNEAIEKVKSYNGSKVEQDNVKNEFTKSFCQAVLLHEQFFFDDLSNSPIQRIEDVKGDLTKYFINNNYNITNQEGLFILNAYPKLSLEESIIERIKRLRINPYISLKEPLKINSQNFVCYDIHKDLKEYVLSILKEDGITPNYIYPNLKKLAESCVVNFLNKVDNY